MNLIILFTSFTVLRLRACTIRLIRERIGNVRLIVDIITETAKVLMCKMG